LARGRLDGGQVDCATWTAVHLAREDGRVAHAVPGPDGLAGRDEELAALRKWLAEALDGRGRLVVVTGPPGIGKTRLAEELAGSARGNGQRVLWGRAVEERGAPPLWPWRRVLNAVGSVAEQDRLIEGGSSDSSRSDDLAAARFRAAAAAADALTGASRAADLLVILEDLQWADHASLFLLRELAAELPESRLLVLATCRDTASDPWRASLGNLARLPGVQVLRLAPLSKTAVAGILQAAGVTMDPELARFVHARSEGNPLYVTTLARVLAAQPGAAADADAVARIAAGSAEVSHLIYSLLRDLDDGASVLLAAASVLGAEFDSGLAAAVSGTSQSASGALSAAQASGLVTRQSDRPGSWRFTHALVRDGIYASLGEDRRIALHAGAAAALEPLARESPERGGEVAAHLLRSAPDRAALRQAVGWAEAAAAAATSALAFEDAARYLATAYAAAQSADVGDAERARLLIELATAQYRAGQLAASLQHAVSAADAAERDGRLDLVADAALVVRGIGHPPVAVTLLGLCDRALADERCPAARRARLLAQRASALAELGDLEAAADGSAEAMAAAAAASDPAAELDAIRARVAALSAPQHRAERLRLGTRAIELATSAGQPLAAVLGRVWRIDAAYQLLNLQAVDVEIASMAQLAESTRLPLARWHLLRQQASRAALAGHLAVAREASMEARRLALRHQDPSGAGLSYVFAVWLAVIRGEAAEIPADFFDFAGAAPPIPTVRAPLARALFAVGRTDEARAVYETLRQLPAAGDKDTRTLGALTLLMDLIIAFRDSEMAQATYDLICPHITHSGATGTGVVLLSGSVHWPLGRLAALLGRTEEALGHYPAAVKINTRLGARPLVALARLDWADALKTRAARGDYEQARVLARQAATEARRLDMPGPAARAERLVHDLEQAIRAGDPLTPREREIAKLVSTGITNRAIASELVLSERTVEGHVRSILAKLQLTNRTELAAWALRDPGP
jgi:DNA-binding CsgD family transcriptional regulator